jgi:hypothetical protein
MINKKREDNGSYKNSKGMFNVSELIQVNKFMTCDFTGEPCNSTNARTAMIKEAKMLTLAIPPDNAFTHFLPERSR